MMSENSTPRPSRMVNVSNRLDEQPVSPPQRDQVTGSSPWREHTNLFMGPDVVNPDQPSDHVDLLSSPPPSRPSQQRRAASANRVLFSAGDFSSSQAVFESPVRSMLMSGPPTASLSANTALASMSATVPSSSTGSFAALANAGARRLTVRSGESVPPMDSTGRWPVTILEKDLDDLDITSSSQANESNANTAAALSRLFVASDAASPPSASREHSHIRSISNIGRSLQDTSTLTGHLFQNGFLGGRHSDITIRCFRQRYRLHRLLLDRIPFFSSAFSGSWAESSAAEMELHPEDVDTNITQLAFELAIKRVYGTPLIEQEYQEAISLFATACWLDMPDLVDSCVDSILRQMQPETLHRLIKLVIVNYYGKAGERILISAKAMLCREGWEMDYSGWDHIPSEIIREVIGGDPFWVSTEWERWFLATKILNRKLKAKAIEAGLVSSTGKFIYPRPSSIRFFAIRFDTTYRQESGLRQRQISEKDEPWVCLYTDPDIAPLLVLLDEGIHYVHLRFEQLQQIRSRRDILGVPILPEKVISDALWMSMELRQRVLNAHENDLELGITEAAEESDFGVQEPASVSTSDKGKGREGASRLETQEQVDESASWDGNGKPRKYWVPLDDISCVMGGDRDSYAHAGTAIERSVHAAQFSASLDPSDVVWASDFVHDPDRLSSQSLSSPVHPRYSRFAPFRFSVEFPNPRTLKEKRRVYSQTFWYAGSLWNIYIQRVNTSKNHQLGIYLHRAKDSSPTDDSFAQVLPASVDDRIGQLEREMLLRKKERRNRPWYDHNMENNPSKANMANPLLTRDGRYQDSDAATIEKDEGAEVALAQDEFRDTIKQPRDSEGHLNDAEEEEAELLRSNRRYDVPTMPPYADIRPVVKTYFKIYSPDKAGRFLNVYESAPEKFVVSKSWGWKSSQTVDETSTGYDMGRSSKDKLRYMVVIGNV